MSEVIVTKENFEEEVINSEKTVLVDLWATWCGPCMMLSPIIEEIAEEYKDTLKVCKINVDEQPELAAAFNVSSIPMLAVIKEGKIVNTAVGYMPKENVLNLL